MICPSASEVIMNNWGEISWYLTPNKTWQSMSYEHNSWVKLYFLIQSLIDHYNTSLYKCHNGNVWIHMMCILWPLLLMWFNFNHAWISNYFHYKVWDEITYPFLNFNSYTVEVWEWISNIMGPLHLRGIVCLRSGVVAGQIGTEVLQLNICILQGCQVVAVTQKATKSSVNPHVCLNNRVEV